MSTETLHFDGRDVSFENHGSLAVVELHTPAAIDWWEENVDDADLPTIGAHRHPVAPRMLLEIAVGMFEAGLQLTGIDTRALELHAKTRKFGHGGI